MPGDALDPTFYDEFAYFADNAAEYDLTYTPPTVRREEISTDDGRTISSLVWGEAPPCLLYTSPSPRD